MKVEKQLFNNFLRTASLNGYIPELVLSFDNDGIKTKAHDAPSTIVMACMLNANAFEDYTPLTEKVGIKNIDKLLVLMKKMGHQLSLQVDLAKAKLIIHDGTRRITQTLVDVDYITTAVRELPSIQFNTSTELDMSVLKNLKDVCDIYKSLVSIEVKDNFAYFKTIIGMDEEYTEKIPFQCKNLTALFGSPLLILAKEVDGAVQISFSDYKAMKIEKRGEKELYKFIIAQRVVEE